MPRIIKASVWEQDPCVIKVEAPAVSKETTGAQEAPQVKKPVFKREDKVKKLREEAERLYREASDTKVASEAMMQEAFGKKKEAESLLEEARSSAAAIKSDAENEKAAILEDAKQQAETVLADAKAQGREEGIAAGREEGIAQIREEQKQILLDANANAEKTMEDAKKESQIYVQQAENIIASLALEIVDKVLPQHFIDVPTIILPLVQQALLKVKDQPSVDVHVSPDNYDLVLMARSEMQNLLEGNAMLEVHSDENLGPGDVVIETPNGDVDAKLSTQMDAIKRAVQDVMT